MKKLILPLTFCLGMVSMVKVFSCDCSPIITEESLDDKLYSGANYVFFTGEILSTTSAFHLEVVIQIDEIFYGSKYIKDVSKPITVYFDLRTACAIIETSEIKAGNKLFITSTYNTMGRMLITNNCDAFFPKELIDTYKLREYLSNLKSQG